MIFRDREGDFVSIDRVDFATDEDYYAAICSVYGAQQQVVGIRDDVDQLEMILELIHKQTRSRL